LAARLYAYAFLGDFILLYPVYALLFAKTGLSAAEISSLFVIWSVTGFALDVPTGPLADLSSRKALLAAAPLMAGAGFLLWTLVPCYASFAVGFVLWGAGGSLRSGTLEALVYEELARYSRVDDSSAEPDGSSPGASSESGAFSAYERIIGRSQAFGTLAVVIADGLAAPVLHVGGYVALGWCSLAVTIVAAAVGWSFPDSHHRGGSAADELAEAEGAYFRVLREGLAEVRHTPALRRALILLAVLTGVFGALEEYVPLLVRSTGVPTAAAPLFVLLVEAGLTVGGWFAGRGTRWAAPLVAAAAVFLATGSAGGRPAGMALVAVAFGVFQWASVTAEARMQDQISDRVRATVV
jgi:MFS family permease